MAASAKVAFCPEAHLPCSRGAPTTVTEPHQHQCLYFSVASEENVKALHQMYIRNLRLRFFDGMNQLISAASSSESLLCTLSKLPRSRTTSLPNQSECRVTLCLLQPRRSRCFPRLSPYSSPEYIPAALPCPCPVHHGCMFQGVDQLYDHAKAEHDAYRQLAVSSFDRRACQAQGHTAVVHMHLPINFPIQLLYTPCSIYPSHVHPSQTSSHCPLNVLTPRRIECATKRLTAANLKTLQAQLSGAQANGTTREEHRKAMCRVQKAAYEMDFSVSAVVLLKARHLCEDWMEEHGH